MTAQLYTFTKTIDLYTKSLNCALKKVNFKVCKLYFNLTVKIFFENRIYEKFYLFI